MDAASGGSPHLPGSLRQFTNGTDLPSKDGQAVSLITTDADGWPHVALLSAGEVLTVSESQVRLALWPTSTTTANLDRTGRGLMVHIADGGAYYIRLVGRRVPIEVPGALACFEMVTEKVTADLVGYAEVLTGITFRLKDPAKVIERWEKTLSKLAAMGSDPGG
jgi:hypothetical protein